MALCNKEARTNLAVLLFLSKIDIALPRRTLGCWTSCGIFSKHSPESQCEPSPIPGQVTRVCQLHAVCALLSLHVLGVGAGSSTGCSQCLLCQFWASFKHLGFFSLESQGTSGTDVVCD